MARVTSSSAKGEKEEKKRKANRSGPADETAKQKDLLPPPNRPSEKEQVLGTRDRVSGVPNARQLKASKLKYSTRARMTEPHPTPPSHYWLLFFSLLF